MRNEKGFTLIEMLIVLLIISVLLLVTIPNVMDHFKTVDEKGCEAYVSMVKSQVEAYKVHNNKYPSVDELIAGNYLAGDEAKCPDGRSITIQKGEVSVSVPSS